MSNKIKTAKKEIVVGGITYRAVTAAAKAPEMSVNAMGEKVSLKHTMSKKENFHKFSWEGKVRGKRVFGTGYIEV